MSAASLNICFDSAFLSMFPRRMAMLNLEMATSGMLVAKLIDLDLQALFVLL